MSKETCVYNAITSKESFDIRTCSIAGDLLVSSYIYIYIYIYTQRLFCDNVIIYRGLFWHWHSHRSLLTQRLFWDNVIIYRSVVIDRGTDCWRWRSPYITSVCCSVLQCVAVCCCVLQCVAVCCCVLQCVAVCCSVLQCVAVCCTCMSCDISHYIIAGDLQQSVPLYITTDLYIMILSQKRRCVKRDLCESQCQKRPLYIMTLRQERLWCLLT